MRAESERVIGVAGHIDHGKTALVKALTGTDTDRLPEEKARGITIELGFAAMDLGDDRRASVIDMPGHERFVRAMIAGAGGVDVLLLVVAANEGVMPQTREHLAIASLMGVRTAVCALSKRDLASDDIVELASEEVRELLSASGYANTPVIPVSALTGEGLDALRDALASAAVTARDASGPVLLPIDRVFVRKGFGVVVTGTLLGGTVREGDALSVGPTGADHHALTVRVRGLQVHGASVNEAHAGTRVAVNLAGVDLEEVPRGAWVFTPEVVALTRSFDAEVTLLRDAPRALGRRSKLEVAAGATHALAAVHLLDGETLEPGSKGLARVFTDRPLALRPGDRVVLRGSPDLAAVGSTVGGAVVLRPEAERARKREVALERARAAHEGDAVARAQVALTAAGAHGLTRAQLLSRAGYTAGEDDDGVVRVGADRWVAASVLRGVEAKVLHALSAHHGAHPEERGIDRRGLASAGDDALVDLALSALVKAGKVARDGALWARAGWKARTAEELPYIGEVRAALKGAGLAPPRPSEVATTLKADAKAIDTALKKLLDRREVVRVSAELWVDAAAIDDLERRLVAHLRERGTIDAQAFKEMTGQTRKYAIPYAEHFDAKKVTLRVGEVRKLRGG
ncbi:MAG: selenocysteine-specific translation elongation factor [Polyangiales bacterium]